jgi:hypothetical protein
VEHQALTGLQLAVDDVLASRDASGARARSAARSPFPPQQGAFKRLVSILHALPVPSSPTFVPLLQMTVKRNLQGLTDMATVNRPSR